MRTYRRNGAWYIDYSLNGRRVRKKVGRSKKLAEIALRDVEVKIVKGEFLGISEPKPMFFESLCAQYLETYSKSNKTFYSYRRDLTSTHSLRQWFNNRLISTITAHDLEDYKTARVKVVKPATVNRELAFIKHMFNKAITWGYLKDNVLRQVRKFKEPPGRIRYLSEDETQRLLDCCNGHVRSAVIMALHTGMRKGEILNLKWCDIDMHNRLITIRHSKNNESRQIPVNNILYNELRLFGQQVGVQYVFCNADGEPYIDIKTGFHAALRRAGINDFRFHDIRHHFSSRLVMAGVDLRTVQELLGHKDIKMTMRYSHLSGDHLKDAVKKLENGTKMAPAVSLVK